MKNYKSLIIPIVFSLILSACIRFDSPDVEPDTFGSSVDFNLPTGLAVDSDGHLYVFDSGNQRVLKFDREGDFILEWGKPGSDVGEFYCYEDKGTICGIAADSQGNIFVVDKGNYRVQKFDAMGNFLTAWGNRGAGDGQFVRPIYVAVDMLGNVFVTDDRNPVIQKFDNDGQFLLKWGSFGTGDGQFRHATGIAVDSNGNVYVSDYENQRVQKFDNNGKYLCSWTTGLDGKTGVPEAITVDHSNRIYITDSRLKQVEVFDESGNSLKTLILPGIGIFNRISPYGVTIDPAGNLYVSDRQNDRILKYEAP